VREGGRERASKREKRESERERGQHTASGAALTPPGVVRQSEERKAERERKREREGERERQEERDKRKRERERDAGKRPHAQR